MKPKRIPKHTRAGFVGKKFFSFTIKKINNRFGEYECECGEKRTFELYKLLQGRRKTCGCILIGNTFSRTHGKSKSKAHYAWAGMKRRCNPNNKAKLDLRNYSGRGISVDPSWDTFERFYKDMGEPTSEKHSLDRIDNDKGYSKENCRWATQKEQCRNKRTNRYLTFNGKTLCLEDWAIKLNMDSHLIRQRLGKGWSVEKTLNTTTDARFRKTRKSILKY